METVRIGAMYSGAHCAFVQASWQVLPPQWHPVSLILGRKRALEVSDQVSLPLLSVLPPRSAVPSRLVSARIPAWKGAVWSSVRLWGRTSVRGKTGAKQV